MTRVIGVSLIAMLTLDSIPLAAQEQGTQLQEVVVTATKTPTPVEQTGSSVSVIAREQIERRQATDAAQILREQPGFTLIQTGTRGALNAEIFTRGGNADMNLVLIDGMKVNSGGGGFSFRDVTTAGVGRIEIVRGPQSALYGPDAMTSVIQFLTPRGEGPFSAWAGGGLGNYDTNESRAGLSWGDRRAGVFLEADRVETSGILRTNNGYRNTTGAARFDLSPIPDLDFTLTGRFNQGRIRFPTENAGDRLQVELDPHQFTDHERLVTTLGTRYRQTGWVEHNVKAGFHLDTFFNQDRRDVPPDAATDPPEGRWNRTTEERVLLDYSATLSLPKIIDVTPQVVLGASYERQDRRARTRPVGLPNRSNVVREAHAGYGQLHLGWRNRIFLTSGGRYDSSSVFGEETTPRVSGAVVAPVTDTRVRGAWGTGIKEPSFGAEFGFPQFGIPANPAIKSEKSRSWEAGVDQPLADRRVQIGVTYFENHFSDLIALPSNPEGFKNIQEAMSQGLELVATLRPLAGWSARASYTYLETEVLETGNIGGTGFVEGEPLLRRPTHSGSVAVDYAVGRFSATAALYVKGDSIDRNFSKAGSPRETLHGYQKLDLSVAYTVVKDVAGLREIVWKTRFQNLLNERYEEVLGFSSPRLSFLTGLEARY